MARTRHHARLNVENLEGRDVPASGALDPTFGINGIASVYPHASIGEVSPVLQVYSSVVQSDGKIVVVGTTGPSQLGTNQYLSGNPNPDFVAIRLNTNGSLDTSFGVDGRTRIPFDLRPIADNRADNAYAVGLQTDGRIVIGGSALNTANPYPTSKQGISDDWALTRLNPDGSLDTTFGTNGLVNYTFNAGVGISDMVIESNDRIVVAGRGFEQNTNLFQVCRLEPRGQLDISFNGTGQVTVTNPIPYAQINNVSSLNSLAVDPTGAIYIAGALPGRGGDFVVAKIRGNGLLDTSFGSFNLAGTARIGFAYAGLNPGYAPNNPPAQQFAAGGFVGDVAIDSAGNILVTGGINGQANFTTVRFTPIGDLDNTFGVNGVVKIGFTKIGLGNDRAEGIGLQPNGKIVLGGEVQTGGDLLNPQTFFFTALRLNTNGALDTTFGTNGATFINVLSPLGDGNLVAAHALSFTTGGKILLVGDDADRLVAVQLTNDVSFNPLPPAPAPLPPSGNLPPVASPGTDINQIAAGAEGSGLVYTQPPVAPNFLYNPTQIANLQAQPPLQFLTQGFTGPIRTSVGDVDGDGTPDIGVITGAGTETRFAVINGANPAVYVVQPIPAFPGSEEFTGGGYISLADINGDGRDEIVISADQGGGPRIEIFQFSSTALPPRMQANFFGIADTNFRGGARTAVGDVNGDGIPDLVVAAGFGGGPRIAIYDGSMVLTTQTKLANDFLAFDASLRDGAFVAVGDVNGDGFGDLIFGAGDGGAPRVLIVGGQKLLEGTAAAIAAPISSFFVGGNSTTRGGVRVAVKDVDHDNKADIVVGSGLNQFSNIRVYKGSSATKGEPSSFQDLNPFNAVLQDGVYVG